MKKTLSFLSVFAISAAILFSGCGKDDPNTGGGGGQAIKGCTDSNSLTYNAAATVDDGSCQYASSVAANRNAVLEEFTGVRCTYCPDGHRKAQAFADANPGRAVLINIHTGSYANPQPTWPDFTTTFGSAIAGISGLTGYPAGQMSRHLFPGASGAAPYYKQGANSLALSRSGFAASGGERLTQPSPVNIGISPKFNASTNELTVIAEAYYTGTETNANHLNVVLLQSGIVGKQIDAGVTNPDYVHNHMLRHMISGQWGDLIPTTTQGTRYQKTFTYTIPDVINTIPIDLNNLYVAAFITSEEAGVKKNILTGVEKKMK
jgi:hypothetical protein